MRRDFALEEEEQDEEDKIVPTRSKYTKPANIPPRDNTRAARAQRLASMGYDTNEEVEADYDE